MKHAFGRQHFPTGFGSSAVFFLQSFAEAIRWEKLLLKTQVTVER